MAPDRPDRPDAPAPPPPPGGEPPDTAQSPAPAQPSDTAQSPEPPDAAQSPAAGPPPEAVRPTVTVSLLAGLCPLIPLPFVDDWAEKVVRRRAVRDLLRERGFDPTPGDVEILAGLEDRGEGRGCLLRALLWGTFKIAFYLVRKVFRKIVFILAANDAVNAASSTFHDVWLLRLALDRGTVTVGPDGRLDRERARRVRGAVEATVEGGDVRPLERTLRRALAGSGKVLRSAARQLGRWARGERRDVGGGGGGEERAARDLPLDAGDRRLAALVDRLVDAVWLERGYLVSLEHRFRHHLAAWTGAGAGTGAQAAGTADRGTGSGGGSPSA